MPTWTPFGCSLFNLVTLKTEGPELQFQERIRVVETMLEAMDAEVAVIEAERAAHLPPFNQQPG